MASCSTKPYPGMLEYGEDVTSMVGAMYAGDAEDQTSCPDRLLLC